MYFPNPELATKDGLLAVGGDLILERLMLAYSMGIFPWFTEGDPIQWWSPDPRCIFDLENPTFPNQEFSKHVYISKSLRKVLSKKKFEVSVNTAFNEVLKHCAKTPRPGQDGTWITTAMQQAYLNLHQNGLAMSYETRLNGELVGGLYGVVLKEAKVFCGESMFSLVSESSKVALVRLASDLHSKGFRFIDAQIPNPHLLRMGAQCISRHTFLKKLNQKT